MKKFLSSLGLCLLMANVKLLAGVTLTTSNGVLTIHVDAGGDLATYCNANAADKATIQSAASIEVTGILNTNDMNVITNYGNSGKITSLHLKGAYVDGFENLSFSNIQNLASFEFPEGANAMGVKNKAMQKNLLQNNQKITSLVVPGNYAELQGLQGMYGLQSLIIANGVTTIDAQCFQNDGAITSVLLPSSLTSLGEEAFKSCTSLTRVSLPEGLTTISSNLFNNTHITSIRLPNTLQTIAANAFSSCQYLTSVTIPENVTSIGENAFYHCNRLRDIYCLATNAPTIADNSFDTHNYYMSNGALESALIPAKAGDVINRAAYWQGSMDKSDYIGEAVLHLPSGLTTAQLAAYTNPARNDINTGDYDYVSPYGDCKWPTQAQKQANYTNETGWKKFGLVTYTKAQEITPVTNIKDDTWYTMCLPVDLTKDQVEATFGPGTDLCEFSAVSYDEATKTITLSFSTPAYTSATDPVSVAAKANHSYMIHPATAPATGSTSISFRVVGVARVTGSNNNLIETVVNNTTFGEFRFKGNYADNTTIPGGYYFLGVKNGVCKYYRESTTTTKKTTWKPYTACVIPPSGFNGAKAMNVSPFGDDDPTVTVITGVSGGCQVNIGNIYHINGQVVKSAANNFDGLSKGIYIMNGKKYLVK